MALIQLKNAGVEFQIHNSNTRSLKNRIINAATGGKITAGLNGRTVVRALNDISFELKEGDKLGLVGHNGSGKSTMLRLLSGVYAPTSGSAIIKGKVGSLIDISLGIDPEATGRENIFLRAALLGMSKTEVADKIEDIIEFTELGNFIDLPLRMYSSGMHMRLAFAVSTVMRPDILLMDEWISVGDEGFKLKAENRLNETVNQTKVLVMASHSKEILEKTCNKILWLEHGSVKMLGETSEVLAQYFKS